MRSVDGPVANPLGVSASGAERVDGPPTRATPAALFTLLVLVLALSVSYLDRNVLPLVIAPVQREFGIGDGQIGLLLGPVFGIFFAVVALPAGWLADRANRRNLAIGAVALWSVATLCSGLATSFGALACARAAVGVGEATLVPLAASLLADIFPLNLRGRAVGAFMLSTYVGGGLSQIVGGALLNRWGSALVTLPIVGATTPWRALFLLAALPGLAVIALLLFVNEPRRADTHREPSPHRYEALRFLRANASLWVGLVIVFGMSAVLAYATVPWAPTVLQRRFGVAPGQAGLTVGLCLLIGGTAGSLICGVIADALISRNVRGGRLLVPIVALPASIPAIAAFTLAPGKTGCIVGLAAIAVLSAMASASTVSVLQDIAPARLRARVTAVTYLFVGLIGMSLGPLATGVVSARVFGGPSGLPLAIVWIATPAVIVGAIAAILAVKRYDQLRGVTGDVAVPEDIPRPATASPVHR